MIFFLLFLHLSFMCEKKMYVLILCSGYVLVWFSWSQRHTVNLLLCTPSCPVCYFSFFICSFSFLFVFSASLVFSKYGNRIHIKSHKRSWYCCRMLFIYGFKLFSMAKLCYKIPFVFIFCCLCFFISNANRFIICTDALHVVFLA